MQVGTVLKILAAFALAVTVALIAAAKAIDTERTKAVLAERLLSATGLRLVFSGPIKLRLGLSPQVSVTGLGLLPPAGVPGAAPVLSIDRIEAQVALLPLIFHELRADRVRLIRPTLRIDPAQLSAVAAAIVPLARVDLASGGDGVPSLHFALSEIRIEDARLVWRGTASRTSAQLEHINGRLTPETVDGGPITLQAKADWNGTPIELGGLIGPLFDPALHRPVPMQIKATAIGAVMVARGTITDLLSGEGLEIDLNAQGDELGDIVHRAGLFGAEATPAPIGPFKLAAKLHGTLAAPRLDEIDAVLGRRDTILIGAKGSIARLRPDPGGVDLALTAEAESPAGPARILGFDASGGGPIKLAARLTDAEGGWRLAGLKSHIGGSDLAGTLSVTWAERPLLGGQLTATSLNPADFGLGLGTEAGHNPDPAHPAESPRPAARPAILVADTRILSPEALPFKRLEVVDLDLTLAAQHLSLGRATLTDAHAQIRLDSGRLAVEGFSARLGNGGLKGEALLDPGQRQPALSLKLSGSGLDLDRIEADAGLPIEGGRADLALDLHGQGTSPRMIAGSLGGTAFLSLGPTRMVTTWAAGIPARLLAALDPSTGDLDPIPLGCLALRVAVHDGIVSAERSLAIESERAGILGSGSLDLRTERLDLIFASRSAAIRLRGALGNPTLGSSGTAAQPGALARAPTRPVFDPQPCRAVIGRR